MAYTITKGYFNPRPREEGDGGKRNVHIYKNYFNPRPREEGDEIAGFFLSDSNISIHALVKRATRFFCSDKTAEQISIHALVKRATC